MCPFVQVLSFIARTVFLCFAMTPQVCRSFTPDSIARNVRSSARTAAALLQGVRQGRGLVSSKTYSYMLPSIDYHYSTVNVWQRRRLSKHSRKQRYHWYHISLLVAERSWRHCRTSNSSTAGRRLYIVFLLESLLHR